MKKLVETQCQLTNHRQALAEVETQMGQFYKVSSDENLNKIK